MRNKVNLIKSEEGFTLIEVIAVLIILGILAAVAVPRYFDLATEATKRAKTAALNEGKAVCTLAYSKASLTVNGEPSTANVATALGLDAGGTPPVIEGDFTYKFTADTTNKLIKIEIAGIAGTSAADITADTNWKMPQ